jgi:predicted nucleic acid-binding protein
MQSTILIDAGPLIALFDSSDKFHERIISFLRNQSFRFVTTLPVLTEVSYMLNFSVNAQIDFFQWVMLKGLTLIDIAQADIPRIIELTKKYRDLPIDFADATLVVVAEKTGIHSIISIDSDFDIYRLPGKRQIKNVFR